MKGYLHIIMSGILLCSQTGVAGDLVCSAPDALALTDRGSLTDTPCVVPNKQVLIEGGHQYQNLIDTGTLSAFPQVQATLGLPKQTEIFVDVPSYIDLSRPHLSGATATNVGAKAEVFATKTWIVSGMGYVTIPGGSRVFGSDGTGATINAIGLYNLNSKISLAAMLGGSSLVMPFDAGGDRFNSFNYSVSLGFAPVEKITLFAEVFGQTKTSPVTGDGVDWNIGMLYVWNKHIVFDVEYADRFSGAIGGFDNSVGAGVTMLLG